MNVLSLKHFTHLKEVKTSAWVCGNMVALDFLLGLERASSSTSSGSSSHQAWLQVTAKLYVPGFCGFFPLTTLCLKCNSHGPGSLF